MNRHRLETAARAEAGPGPGRAAAGAADGGVAWPRTAGAGIRGGALLEPKAGARRGAYQAGRNAA